MILLTREIHNLQQQVEAREGHPTKGFDHIDHLEWELQTLSHSGHNPLQPQHPQNYLERWYTNTQTIYALHKSKQILTNSLLQDITIFNKHDSSKLDEWLTDLETAVYLTSES